MDCKGWAGVALVLALVGNAAGAMRYLEGVGIPTTEAPGGELIEGTIDWGTPETRGNADYDVNFGEDNFAGTFILLLDSGFGDAAQMIYQDFDNGLVMTATSADGPVSSDAADFVDTAGYGGFEFWTLTDTSGEINRYGSITSITNAVPEPDMMTLFGAALSLFVGLRLVFG